MSENKATDHPKPVISAAATPTVIRLMPELAREIGLNESLLLLQIGFWISHATQFREGQWWFYKSAREMRDEAFCFWSVATITRTIKSLKEKNLVHVTDRYNKRRSDQTPWFALNIEAIDNLKSISVLFQDKSGNLTKRITPLQIETSGGGNSITKGITPLQSAGGVLQSAGGVLQNETALPIEYQENTPLEGGPGDPTVPMDLGNALGGEPPVSPKALEDRDPIQDLPPTLPMHMARGLGGLPPFPKTQIPDLEELLKHPYVKAFKAGYPDSAPPVIHINRFELAPLLQQLSDGKYTEAEVTALVRDKLKAGKTDYRFKYMVADIAGWRLAQQKRAAKSGRQEGETAAALSPEDEAQRQATLRELIEAGRETLKDYRKPPRIA